MLLRPLQAKACPSPEPVMLQTTSLSVTERLVSMVLPKRRPLSRQDSYRVTNKADNIEGRGFNEQRHAAATEPDHTLPMLIDMGFHK